MKTIFILRHAKSSWAQPGVPDIERPLNGRGRKQCAMLQDWMKSQGVSPDRVIASPSARTRETASRVSPALGEAPVEFIDQLYAGSIDTYMSQLWSADGESVLLIGHNPTCDELVRYLATPDTVADTVLATQGYPTAALSVLEFECGWAELGKASAKLKQFITAKSLEKA